jgi:methylated-DNA-[protein]-cysteine S-methyltransferase
MKATVIGMDATEHLEMESPVGRLRLSAASGALVGVAFARGGARGADAGASALLVEARRQLEEYFSGDRTAFELPLAPAGTAFQQEVWRTLRTIPHGEAWSYRRLALAIGRPSATRAVGAANGRNPIAIVIPCHRVIGADGSLTGYGGGLPVKTWLLEHERRSGARPGVLHFTKAWR